MRRRRAVLALLGLGAGLALVWVPGAGVLARASAPIAQREAKLAAAERLIFYRVEPGETLRVLMPTDAQAIRLVTHLVLPEGSQYVPERQYVYGLQLRLVNPDATVRLERTLFTRTRQSKQEYQEGTWLKEAAFSSRPEVQVTDSREFVVELPEGGIRRHSGLFLDHPGGEGALLVRVYARSNRPLTVFASRHEVALKQAEARVERATWLSWERLSEESRQHLTQDRWERLSAEGKAGVDYRLEALYRTDFRLPLAEVAEGAEERLEPGRAVALNVVGPQRLTLRLWRPPAAGDTPATSAPGTLSATLLGADGTLLPFELPAPQEGGLGAHPLDVPAGVHTLSLTHHGAQSLRFSVEGAPEGWLSEAPRPEGATPVAYLPDVRRSDAWVAGPDCQPLEVEVGRGLSSPLRLLWVEARGLGATPAGLQPSQVAMELLDARGRVLDTLRLDVPAQSAPHEGLEVAARPEAGLPCQAGGDTLLEGRPLAVSQEARGTLVLPAGVHRVRLRATHPTALLLSSQVGTAELGLPRAPYSEEGLVAVRWRHAPRERLGWLPVRPANHLALALHGARGVLLRQVRLEPEGGVGGSAGPTGEPVALQPVGSPPQSDVLEPLQGPLEEGRPGVVSLLAPGRPVRLHFAAAAASRPELRLRVEGPEGLGHPVELLLDGQPLLTSTLRSTRARLLLPPVTPGNHEVVLRSAAPGLSATLDRPTATDAAQEGRVRRRTWHLGQRGLKVPVYKRGRGALTLNIVLYGPSRAGTEAPEVAVSIDGGAPRRSPGLLLGPLTRGERQLPLPPSERPEALEVSGQRDTLYSRTLHVRLGEDLAPGLHWVRVEPMGRQPLRARFFVFGTPRQDTSPVRQWLRTGWELEGEP